MNPQRIHYRSDRPDPIICSLFVHRAMMAPASTPWRLLRAESAESDSFVHAEGECSAKCFRTMREAIAYGQRAYGETATRFPD